MGGDGCRTKQTRRQRRRRRPDIKAALLQIKEAASTVNCCHRWKPSMSQPGTAAGQPFHHQSVCKCTGVDGHCRRCRCHRTEDFHYICELTPTQMSLWLEKVFLVAELSIYGIVCHLKLLMRHLLIHSKTDLIDSGWTKTSYTIGMLI